MRNRRGDLRRREQNAAADDVRDDDRRGIERAETPLERRMLCGGWWRLLEGRQDRLV